MNSWNMIFSYLRKHTINLSWTYRIWKLHCQAAGTCVLGRHSQESDFVWLQVKFIQKNFKKKQSFNLRFVLYTVQVTDRLLMVNYPHPATDTLPSKACQSLSSSWADESPLHLAGPRFFSINNYWLFAAMMSHSPSSYDVMQKQIEKLHILEPFKNARRSRPLNII